MARRSSQLSLFTAFQTPDSEPVLAINGTAIMRWVHTPDHLPELIDAIAASTAPVLTSHQDDQRLLGLALQLDPASIWYVPVSDEQGRATNLVDEVLAVLTAAPCLITHDAKTFLHDLHRAGILWTKPPVFFDIMVAAHLCQRPTTELDLPALAAHYLPETHPLVNIDSKRSASSLFAAVLPHEITEALQSQLDALTRVHPILEAQMRLQGVDKLFHEVEMPLLQVLFEMERDGVAIDRSYLVTLSAELGQRLADLETRIFALAGQRFNVGSPQQLSRILFEVLELPTERLGKTWRSGNISTSMWSLDTLRNKHPIIPLVLEHRELSKLKGTYADAFPELLDPRDGLLHCTFNQVNTVSGRLSASQPNLQNIPITTEIGRRVRQAFVSRHTQQGGAGCIISVDYSQVELRILAHLANDAALIAAFERDEDIHVRTAATVFNVPIAQVTKEQRGHAKRINFGIAYGMGPKSLAASTGMSLDEGKDFINRYFRSFPAVHRWIQHIKQSARAKGYVETLLGRRRSLPRLLAGSDANIERKARAEREAINTVVQGSAADVMKVTMIHMQRRLQAEGLNTKMVLQVHDELVFDVPEYELTQASALIREVMCHAYPLQVKLAVDLVIGSNWDNGVSVNNDANEPY